jgi:hypothetical protein
MKVPILILSNFFNKKLQFQICNKLQKEKYLYFKYPKIITIMTNMKQNTQKLQIQVNMKLPQLKNI